MARKTKAEALATRRDILDAAIQVFLQRGVASASLEEIAEQAGVTRGAIYWHFKNKLEIFQQLNAEVQAFFLETVLQDLDKEEDDLLEQLRRRCIQLLRDLENDKRRGDILRILFLYCDYSGDLAPQLLQQTENRENNVRVFSRYFQNAVNKGQLSKDANARILAQSLICYLAGIAFEYFRSPGELNLKNNAEKLINQFFCGLTGG